MCGDLRDIRRGLLQPVRDLLEPRFGKLALDGERRSSGFQSAWGEPTPGRQHSFLTMTAVSRRSGRSKTLMQWHVLPQRSSRGGTSWLARSQRSMPFLPGRSRFKGQWHFPSAFEPNSTTSPLLFEQRKLAPCIMGGGIETAAFD